MERQALVPMGRPGRTGETLSPLLGLPGPPSVTGTLGNSPVSRGPEGMWLDLRGPRRKLGSMLREEADIGSVLSSCPGAWHVAEATAVFYFGLGVWWSGRLCWPDI